MINPSAVSYGATGQPQITNRTDCENLCTNDASCLSYQLDDNDFRSAYCWLQKSLISAGLNDTNNLYPRGRVTEWAKTTTCTTPGEEIQMVLGQLALVSPISGVFIISKSGGANVR